MRLLVSLARTRTLVRLAALSAVGLAGCSLIYDVSGVQCSQTSDCERLGAAFADTVCQRSFCVTPEGTGGSGMGGGNDPSCTSHAECLDLDLFYGEPAACMQQSCVQLTTAECPLVFGLGDNEENLRKPEPIFIGAYAPIDDLTPQLSPHPINYELAIDEMNRETLGGLSGGPGGSSRPFIAIVCQGVGETDLEASMDHLIDELEVPAILAGLNAPELKENFNTRGHPNEVFFLSPVDADTTLTGILDDGLLWHMLPEGLDLAPGYVPLLHDTEEYLRLQEGLEPPHSIKVALVEARSQFLLDISGRLMDTLTFNDGLTPGENEENGHFLRLRTDSAAEVALPNVSTAATRLIEFEPDIVISLGAEESLEMIRLVEQGWAPALGPKPFYLVSPWVFGVPELRNLTEVHDRLMGVNFAGAEDTSLYEDLQDTLNFEYEEHDNLDGKENYYDAAYYLMYAIAAAGDPGTLRGSHVREGLARVIEMNSPQSFPVGPDSVAYALQSLASPNAKIKLVGTLGEPDFNRMTGARSGVPSYFCVHDGERIQDALRYDETTETVVGTQSCVPYFPP